MAAAPLRQFHVHHGNILASVMENVRAPHGHCCCVLHGKTSRSDCPVLCLMELFQISSAMFFQCVREVFDVFVSFSKFSHMFRLVWTCSDTFGCIRMRVGAFRRVRTLSENFEFFEKDVPNILLFCTFERFLLLISLVALQAAGRLQAA